MTLRHLFVRLGAGRTSTERISCTAPTSNSDIAGMRDIRDAALGPPVRLRAHLRPAVYLGRCWRMRSPRASSARAPVALGGGMRQGHRDAWTMGNPWASIPSCGMLQACVYWYEGHHQAHTRPATRSLPHIGSRHPWVCGSLADLVADIASGRSSCSASPVHDARLRPLWRRSGDRRPSRVRSLPGVALSLRLPCPSCALLRPGPHHIG